MSDGQEQRIYQAVRALLEQMTPEMRAQAEALLARAERGEKTDVDLLKLIRTDKKLGETLARHLSDSKAVRSGYSPLLGFSSSPPARKYVCPQCNYTFYLQKVADFFPTAGNPTPPPSRKYVCPQCNYTFYPQKSGEQPGKYPRHDEQLVPAVQKRTT